MWHASVGKSGDAASRRLKALTVLAGVGDASLGEWFSDSPVASHVRRRLSESEAALIGPVVDVRGTDEGASRVSRMAQYLPHGWTEEV